MKSRRFLALILATLMLFSSVIMTGCGDSGNNEETEPSGIVTLNMFMITEDETSISAANEVQMAINEITVPQYKTLIKINYLTKDEYWETVEKVEKETIDYLSSPDLYNNSSDAEEGSETKDIAKMSFNEAIDYVFELTDVEITKPQIDILVVDDYDKFIEMANEKRLAEIDLKYDRKVIKKYVHPTILSTTTVDKKTYGVPVNFAMNGEYEYLVFNKNLLDKYGYKVADLRKIEEMGEYFALIKRNEPGVFPLSEIPELAGVELYDDVLYAQSSMETITSSSLPVFMSGATYLGYLNTTNSYRKNGYVAADAGFPDAPCAVRYETSTKIEDHEYTENGVTYQRFLYDIPRVDSRDTFKAALCVSAYSLNKAKAAKILELLTIDSELANLLQYGIEGTHYRVEDGIVNFIETEAEDTYKMNNYYTGNIYVKYETDDSGYIENAKRDNLSTAPSVFFGYNPVFTDMSSKSVYECVRTFSKEALDRIRKGELTVDDAFNIGSKQLNALGVSYNSNGGLDGVFGKLASEQQKNTANITSSFVLSEVARTYNDVYKTDAEIAAELEAEEAAKAAELEAKEAAELAALEAQIEAENKKKQEEEAAEAPADPTED